MRVPGVIDQSQYGKRGILRNTDFYRKQPEFAAWLTEVKGTPNAIYAPKGEVLVLFAEYCEEYNCMTLPEKYYDLEAYEASAAASKSRPGAHSHAGASSVNVMDDAKRIKQANAAAAQLQGQQRLAAYKASMDPARIAELKERGQLQQQLEYAFKAGQKQEVERLQRVLAGE